MPANEVARRIAAIVIAETHSVHFFGSIAISRWRACHSWSGYCSVRDLKKPMIILRRHFIVAQVIISGGAKKIADRNLRQKLGAGVRRLDGEFVVLVLVGRHRQIAICLAKIGLELDRSQQFLLRLGKFPLLQEVPRPAHGAIRRRPGVRQQRAVRALLPIVFLALEVQVRQDRVCSCRISGVKLQRRLQFGDCVVVLSDDAARMRPSCSAGRRILRDASQRSCAKSDPASA